MNLMTYQEYCKKYSDFSNYNQLVDPNIFNLTNGSSKSQVRLSEVETTNVPAMVESIRNHGQLAPCSVTKNSYGHWELKEGFTRTAAVQQIVEDDPAFKLLISDGIDQVEGYGADDDAWFDFGCRENNHLPNTPNSLNDIEVQIAWRIDNGYFDRKAGCKRHQNPKVWMNTAVAAMKAVYSNNSITTVKLHSHLANTVAKKQAPQAAL